MKPKLIQEQSLQWKMNQSLLQAIHILQLSSVELVDYLKQLSKENPLIEDVEYNFDFSAYKDTAINHLPIGETKESAISMYEQLKKQLYTLDIPQEILPVVLFGIDSLNEDGYLEISLEVWASACNTSVEIVEQALDYIQQLDPPGIGARSFQECILLQLTVKSHEEKAIHILLNEHLDWIADENTSAISETYAIAKSDAENIIEQIKASHPKPGQLLSSKRATYIIPEASIIKEKGAWKIKFFHWSTPTISLNKTYKQLDGYDAPTLAFIEEKKKQIERINQAIGYRSTLIQRIIQTIIEKQMMYFEHGATWLKPLTLKEVAERIRVSISTVSRTIQGKYVQTPQGIIELKFFFQPGIKQKNGSAISAFALKYFIREVVQLEDKHKPFSDEAIKKEIESAYGIQVARRTIAKYRELLHIRASTKRRQGGRT
ncbi:RNA polymerase factor sigma-54 [Virgibacillus sp. LDC-1]|uniref:RNA polymerase factor sigma-54 n=1 Tax=Virgibacillus sp. LDC-1 TaxID=3039856 RepID=UPI0024DEB757|nr:RNA polymerase factor sigma-54 [Virgibacillus sp. LDC-1]